MANKITKPRTSKSAQALDSYMAGILPVTAAALPGDDSLPGNTIWVDIERVEDNPWQPRLRIEQSDIDERKTSMDENGQLQAALGRPKPNHPGYYQLADGHTRKEAIKAGANAGITLPNPQQYIGKIRLDVQDISDTKMLDYAFAANEERTDFTVFDRAHYYEQKRKLNPGSTPEKPISWEKLVADEKLPVTARMIRNIVQAMWLPQKLREALQEINLSDDPARTVRPGEKHCRAFLSLQPAGQDNSNSQLTQRQRDLLKELKAEKLSGNETMRRAAALLNPQAGAGDNTAGTAVSSTGGGGGSGGSGSPPPVGGVGGGEGSSKAKKSKTTTAAPAATPAKPTAEDYLARVTSLALHAREQNSLAAALHVDIAGAATPNKDILHAMVGQAKELEAAAELLNANTAKLKKVINDKTKK